MARAGHLLTAGPLRHDRWRALGIWSAEPEQVRAHVAAGPLVRARRLAATVMPWMVPTGAISCASAGGSSRARTSCWPWVAILLIAGYETTVNLIATGTLLLLTNPDQLARLGQDPELVGPAVEELLRLGSPVDVATERYAREDVEVAGVSIPRGSLVLVALVSANTAGPASVSPRAWTSPAETTTTSRSGSAPTTAWAPRSPGWRAASRSDR